MIVMMMMTVMMTLGLAGAGCPRAEGRADV